MLVDSLGVDQHGFECNMKEDLFPKMIVRQSLTFYWASSGDRRRHVPNRLLEIVPLS
jgi:hypothetical protein